MKPSREGYSMIHNNTVYEYECWSRWVTILPSEHGCGSIDMHRWFLVTETVVVVVMEVVVVWYCFWSCFVVMDGHHHYYIPTPICVTEYWWHMVHSFVRPSVLLLYQWSWVSQWSCCGAGCPYCTSWISCGVCVWWWWWWWGLPYEFCQYNPCLARTDGESGRDTTWMHHMPNRRSWRWWWWWLWSWLWLWSC